MKYRNIKSRKGTLDFYVEEQAWLNECAKHCRCSREICDSVLQGAPCEERIEPDDLDDNLP